MSYKRVILVTGANTGIGLEVVIQLAAQKQIVYLSSLVAAKGKAAVKVLKDQHDLDVKFVQLDITDLDSIKAARALIEKQEGRLDVLVNNAGVSFMEKSQRAQDATTIPVIRDAFEINFYGTIQTTIEFLPLLRKAPKEYASIVNVTTGMASNSVMASPQGRIYPQTTAYNTCKAALNSYSIHLAMELKDEGIRVNLVSPGFTSTKLNGFGEGGHSPEEGASIIVPYAMLGPEDKDVTAKFFFEGGEHPW